MNKYTLERIANERMVEWGLAEKGWTFETIDSASVHGDCNETDKIIRVSAFIAQTESDANVLDTILHEIAHALVGCWHMHDLVWKAKAKQVGASTKATCEFSEETHKAILLHKAKYVMVYKDKVVKVYLRKPNKKTILGIENYYVRGKKAESIGKLAIQVYNAKIHKEYV